MYQDPITNRMQIIVGSLYQIKNAENAVQVEGWKMSYNIYT